MYRGVVVLIGDAAHGLWWLRGDEGACALTESLRREYIRFGSRAAASPGWWYGRCALSSGNAVYAETVSLGANRRRGAHALEERGRQLRRPIRRGRVRPAIEGVSMMDLIARRGFDVYLIDVHTVAARLIQSIDWRC
jgi:hypothetical protein